MKTIIVVGCFDNCPLLDGEHGSCQHPDAPRVELNGGRTYSREVNYGPGGINSQRYGPDGEIDWAKYDSARRPLWCPLLTVPLTIRGAP